MLFAVSSAVIIFWAIVLADPKRWWPAKQRLVREGLEPVPRDTVVAVPARDEEEVIRECLPSLLRQCEDFAQLVYVDDRSGDRTGEIARELTSASGRPEATRVLDGQPPPEGWSGKLHALQTAIDFALSSSRGRSARWFLFTDADILHPENSLRALRAKADEGPHDLVSVMVRLRARSFWERLLIPPFVYFFQLLYPFRRVSDPSSARAAAAGGCLLISRDLLGRLGGLASIRSAVIDDIALARRAKSCGGRLWLGICPDMESRRRYERLGEIARMVSRTAFTELRKSCALLALCLLGMAVFLVSPPFLALAAVSGDETGALLAALGGWALQAATLYPVVRHHRVPGRYALTLPVASIFYMWMTALSAWNHLRGRGVRWKGRDFRQGG